MKLIVTVLELECGVLDNVTYDDLPCKHGNVDVRYRPRCPVCRNHRRLCSCMPWDLYWA